ncbi:MAG: ROK family protein [Planctomycetota bacterium]|nr:MAG: ROK family protein [Planctomycetota bacterium]
MPKKIGVDLGGTFIKAGVVHRGVVLRRHHLPTQLDFDRFCDDIVRLIQEVSQGGPMKGVGIGVPGVTDPDHRVVLDSPNLRFLEEQPLVDRLEQTLGVPIHLENDANAATFGEAKFGAGRQFPSFLLATIGTGIGGGVFLNGQLWRGPGGMAGEFGHLFAGHDRRCGCGATGCLEAAVSATSLVRWAKDEGIVTENLKGLADQARRGDRTARVLFEKAGLHLGTALAQVVLLLDLRVFLFGGGGSPILDLIRPTALQALALRANGRQASEFQLSPAELGNDAGILGAAELASQRLPV